MDTPLTTHLTYEPREAVRARKTLAQLVEQPGWQAFKDAIEMRQRALLSELIALASDSGADYARIAGEIAGLQSIEGIVAGVMELGERAERRLSQE